MQREVSNAARARAPNTAHAVRTAPTARQRRAGESQWRAHAAVARAHPRRHAAGAPCMQRRRARMRAGMQQERRRRTFSSFSSSCCSSSRSPDFLSRPSQKALSISAVLTRWMSLLTNSSNASFIACARARRHEGGLAARVSGNGRVVVLAWACGGRSSALSNRWLACSPAACPPQSPIGESAAAASPALAFWKMAFWPKQPLTSSL